MTNLRFDMATLVVPDYDVAIDFYTSVLGFNLAEDTQLGNGKRWVVVRPNSGAALLLALAANDGQKGAIGNQTGGRVAFFLQTDDFAQSHAQFVKNGAIFLEEPRHEPYGTVAVFSDPFGNHWDLIEIKKAA